MFNASKKELFNLTSGYKTLQRRLKSTWNVSRYLLLLLYYTYIQEKYYPLYMCYINSSSRVFTACNTCPMGELVLLFITYTFHSNKDDVTLNNLMKAKLVIFSHPREKFTSGEVSDVYYSKTLSKEPPKMWPRSCRSAVKPHVVAALLVDHL